jgi:RNA polymerase sigma factor (sigma-70 family)
MKEIADDELFELIKQSNYPAFTELYHRHWKYIYGIAYRKIADKDDAFDLTQNVFIEFYEKREKLIINIPVKNFLRTAAIYKLAKYFRARGFQEKHYHNFQQFLNQVQESDISFDTLVNRETEIQFEEMVALVYQTIDEMPDKMKEIFLLSRSGQYSVTEIADKLGIAPQTVKNQVSKAFSRIRTVAKENNLSVAHIILLAWLTQS